jgi:hypothetical protein
MLGPVIQNLVKSAVKNAANFEVAIDPLIAKLSQSCPSKSELDKILTKKNQLSQALTQVQTSLTTITDTSSTLDDILSGLNAAVTVIKLIPIPASVPPGVGIPLNVINGFSSGLDTLGTLIKEGKGTVSQVSPSIKIITDNIAKIQDKLSQLDELLVGCLDEQVEEDLLWSPTKDYLIDDQVYLINAEEEKDYYIASQDNLDKRPDQNPTIWGESDENSAKEKYFSKLGIDLSSPPTTGDGTNGIDSNGNEIQGNSLEDRLNPNSTNPYVYKGYTIVLDSNKENKFSFPERRAVGTSEDGDRIVGPWSYSSSTQVLVDGVQFLIDKQNSIALRDAEEAALLEQLRIKQERAAEEARKRREAKLKLELESAFSSGLKAAKSGRLITSNPFTRDSRQDLKAEWDKGYRSFIAQPQSSSSQPSGGGFANATTTSTPPPDYTPFNGPGTINGEVRLRGGKYFRYLSGQKKWVNHTPSYTPFTSKGTTNSETRINEYSGIQNGLSVTIKDTYEWNQTLFKWTFKSRDYSGGGK